MPTETVVIEAGFPVSEPFEATDEVHPLTLPGGRAVQMMHIGPYEQMAQAYIDLQAWMQEQGLTPASGMWETYLSSPMLEPDPSGWKTLIIWPITWHSYLVVLAAGLVTPEGCDQPDNCRP